MNDNYFCFDLLFFFILSFYEAMLSSSMNVRSMAPIKLPLPISFFFSPCAWLPLFSCHIWSFSEMETRGCNHVTYMFCIGSPIIPPHRYVVYRFPIHCSAITALLSETQSPPDPPAPGASNTSSISGTQHIFFLEYMPQVQHRQREHIFFVFTHKPQM